MTERHRIRRPGAAPVIWGSAALFVALFVLLTYQLAMGRDPALGARATADRRPVVIRRVVKHRIVTTVVPATAPSDSGVAGGSTSTATTPAPAPAPAPPPVVTSSS